MKKNTRSSLSNNKKEVKKVKNPYLPHTDAEIREMLKEIGVSSIGEIYEQAIGKNSDIDLKIPDAICEYDLLRDLKELSEKNINFQDYAIYLGAGIYNHFIPSVVFELASRGELLTAYTPYQPEVSQGTLQALFEYQTMICELTKMEVANSSMYDGASALAEAVLMAHSINEKNEVVISEAVHPEYREVVKTYSRGKKLKVINLNYDDESGTINLEDLKNKITENTSCVVVQYPNFFGIIEDLKEIRETIPENIIYIVVANPIALGILEPPGKFGADIVVGEGQALGNPGYFGGPGFGFFATREKYLRKMPGRLIGQTVDSQGKRGFVMTFQTREQHIRRAKATSNICSNHSHNAVTAAIYMSLLGKEGLKEVANLSLQKAHYLAEKLDKLEHFQLKFSGPFFHEFVLETDLDWNKINKYLIEQKILGPMKLGRFYKNMEKSALFCVTEMLRREDLEFLSGRLGAIVNEIDI